MILSRTLLPSPLRCYKVRKYQIPEIGLQTANNPIFPCRSYHLLLVYTIIFHTIFCVFSLDAPTYNTVSHRRQLLFSQRTQSRQIFTAHSLEFINLFDCAKFTHRKYHYPKTKNNTRKK